MSYALYNFRPLHVSCRQSQEPCRCSKLPHHGQRIQQNCMPVSWGPPDAFQELKCCVCSLQGFYGVGIFQHACCYSLSLELVSPCLSENHLHLVFDTFSFNSILSCEQIVYVFGKPPIAVEQSLVEILAQSDCLWS